MEQKLALIWSRLKKSQRAFAGNLRFEHTGVAAFFIDVVSIAQRHFASARQVSRVDDAPSPHLHIKGSHIHLRDAREHAVRIALAECHRALFERHRYVSLDQLRYHFLMQKTTQAHAKLERASSCSRLEFVFISF